MTTDPTTLPDSGLRAWTPVVLVFLILAVVVALGLDRGWLPHDDGYLALSAEKVLQGETPHRDFDEIYTGGLTYLNAWALDLFGRDLAALRVPYLAALGAFLASSYALLRRYLGPLQAALAASSVVLLGPFMTRTPMPSSYNVFVAGVVLLTIAKYFETRARPWLLAAGFMAGLGVLIKTTGLYLVLGVGIGLIAFHASQRQSGPDRWDRVLLVSAAMVVTIFLATQPTFSRLIGLAVPVWLAVALVLRSGSNVPESERSLSESSLVSLGTFAGSLFVPLLLFGLYMASQGALEPMMLGLVKIPSLYVNRLLLDLPVLISIVVPVGLALVVWRAKALLQAGPSWLLGLVGSLLVLAWYVIDPRSELSVLFLILSWTPLLVLLFAYFYKDVAGRLATPDPLVLTMLACAACMQLVRFPTSNQFYLFYSLPLALLVCAMLVGRGSWSGTGAVVSLALVAGIMTLAHFEGRIFSSGQLGARVPYISLDAPKGGIEIPAHYDYYNSLARDEALEQSSILAGPDAPELYFLFDKDLPGRTAFPLIGEAVGEPVSMLDTWSRTNPGVVILNSSPANSEINPDFVAEVRQACSPPRVYGPLELYALCPS